MASRLGGRLVRVRWFSVVRVIAGLGNPGPEYAHSRHNAGFMVLDRLAQRNQVEFGRVRDGAVSARLKDALLVKPVMYMNLSGGPVAAAARYYKVDIASKLLVVSDDVALPPGKTSHVPRRHPCGVCLTHAHAGTIRFARSGGAGGQNGVLLFYCPLNLSRGASSGLASVIQMLGTKDFHRLRIGIGPPASRAMSMAEHVIQKVALFDLSADFI